MTTITGMTAVAGAVVIAAVAFAGGADAAPIEGSSVSSAVAALQADGYNVQLNGAVSDAPSRCTVTAVHGLTGKMPSMDMLMTMMDPTEFDTVYLDVSCPSSNN